MNDILFSLTGRTLAFLFLVLVAATPHAHAYGPDGHKIVGAIADERLAHSPVAAKIRAMLQGYTLEKAATIPDDIKGWDKKGVDAPGIFRYTSRPLVDAQLAAFWRANPPTHDHKSPMPSHHWFHYTDVPVLNPEKYRDGKTGRDQWDIVHMIRYCVRVLKGEEPEENARKITKPIAVILLAHYVGDIHQPLHAGAEYFDRAGQPVDPDKGTPGLEDQGGNTIMLKHTAATAAKIGKNQTKLHGFWDNQSVAANLPTFPKEMPKPERRTKMDAARKVLVQQLATTEPSAWRPPANAKPEDYGEVWVDDILPIAREAHERLQFSGVAAKQQDAEVFAAGFAQEKPPRDGVHYDEWAAKTVREELHKAGWRLADLLEKCMGNEKATPAAAGATPESLLRPATMPTTSPVVPAPAVPVP
ncbi:MAG TPA: S1/P1 nuclease [Chthoniobacterales bacterium]|nr:S1/P1 nuclease [Chthoniobacterales bacterium]